MDDISNDIKDSISSGYTHPNWQMIDFLRLIFKLHLHFQGPTVGKQKGFHITEPLDRNKPLAPLVVSKWG